ncbi:VanZ family protein [Clostridium boliviensis]|uniref:VanZ family protein n=1 Tax=Clostridium boliviensis TaxID=318465 RepID=A0ABU4GSP1_9CLOT|nr:VanZ family protein [Clostridium boliviensis]MDW2799212.1 VanZ family protein [Clostridium boliviensis]
MKKRLIWTVAAVLYILLIYSNSLKSADLSSADSGHVLELLKNLFTTAGVESRWLTEHIIRKAGHFTEYTLLGLILYQCVKLYDFDMEKRLFIHGTAGFMIPFIDETIQLFVSGRSGQISDVWLDFSGVAAGTVIAALLFFIYTKEWSKI